MQEEFEDILSMFEADIMISDWSGVAYEYAFATEFPVLFIDSPEKIQSTNHLWHNLSAMEDVCRKEIGIVRSYRDRVWTTTNNAYIRR